MTGDFLAVKRTFFDFYDFVVVVGSKLTELPFALNHFLPLQYNCHTKLKFNMDSVLVGTGIQ